LKAAAWVARESSSIPSGIRVREDETTRLSVQADLPAQHPPLFTKLRIPQPRRTSSLAVRTCRPSGLKTTAKKLALEMATTDDAERRALDGEIAVLEEAWREAEEIAAIRARGDSQEHLTV
jgi:hypothetical protein